MLVLLAHVGEWFAWAYSLPSVLYGFVCCSMPQRDNHTGNRRIYLEYLKSGKISVKIDLLPLKDVAVNKCSVCTDWAVELH